MFDFLGTFTEGELEGLFSFVETHEPDLKRRIVRYRSKIRRLGWIYYEEDSQGEKTGYTIQPESSQLAKHLRSFLYYGGDPIDLDIIDRADWIYLKKGSPDIESDYRGGEPSRDKYTTAQPYDDKDPAIFVGRLKEPFEQTIKRIENLEFRIKRTVDLGDQYIREAVNMANRNSGADSIEDLKETIQQFVQNDSYPSAGEGS